MKGVWSDAELELLRSMYPHCQTADIAVWLGRGLSSVRNAAFLCGLKKDDDLLKSLAMYNKSHQQPSMMANRYKSGVMPWNKGISFLAGGRSAETRFKLGNRTGAANINWVPIGSTRVDRGGCLVRKVGEGSGKKDWIAVHRLVWELENGPTPGGHVVVFKAGKKTTELDAIRIDGVECISRAELMRRNSYLTKYPPEVAKLVQLRGALNRQINKRTKEHS